MADDLVPSTAPVFAFGRTHQQRATDIFRGTTQDRLGDEGFADPRETRLVGIINNILRVNNAVGDPLGLGAGDDTIGGPTSGPSVSEAPPGAAQGDAFIDGERDP